MHYILAKEKKGVKKTIQCSFPTILLSRVVMCFCVITHFLLSRVYVTVSYLRVTPTWYIIRQILPYLAGLLTFQYIIRQILPKLAGLLTFQI